MPEWDAISRLISDSSPQAVMTAAVLWAFYVLMRKFVIGDAKGLEKPAAERLAEVTAGGPLPGLNELLARLLQLEQKLDRLDLRIERVERRFEALPCASSPTACAEAPGALRSMP